MMHLPNYATATVIAKTSAIRAPLKPAEDLSDVVHIAEREASEKQTQRQPRFVGQDTGDLHGCCPAGVHGKKSSNLPYCISPKLRNFSDQTDSLKNAG
jgi:hypothetical protein